MYKISLGLHNEGFVIKQPNIKGILPIFLSEEAAISARSPVAKRKEKSTIAIPVKKHASASAADTEPVYGQQLTKATTTLSLGDKSSNGAILKSYKEEGHSPTQWGGHVDVTGLRGPYLIGGWKRQEDDPDNKFVQIKRKFTIV